MYNPYALESLQKCLKNLKKKGYLADGEFEFRLIHFYQALYSAYGRVYGNTGSAERDLQNLLVLLAEKYSARSSKLKHSDRRREKNPEWYLDHRLAGMMLYTDRFAGDLSGISRRLDYFSALNINLLHLMPLLVSPEAKNDGGYAVSDFLNVDPRLGTTTQLEDLCEELHARDMFLMLDLVVNHASDEHVWAEKAKKGQKKYREYFYTFEDRLIPDLYERAMPEIFPENAPGNFTWNEEMQRWVMTVFNSYQWDLNYANPKVFHEMLDILLTQANWGVDIFRLDAVAFLWKKMGTASQNLEQAHEILQLFKICTQIVAPGVLFLAEAIVAPAEIMKYFGETETWSNECDIAYNATLMASLWDAVATGNTRILSQAVRNVPRKPPGTTWVNYIRCHDDIGLGYENQYISNSGYEPRPHRDFMISFLTGNFEGSFARGLPFMVNPQTHDARISGSLASLAGLEAARQEGDEAAIMMARKRIVMLQGIVIAWEGIPVIYYGDELATMNDYSFTDDPAHADDNRWMHRPCIDWTRVEKRHEKGTDEEYVFSSVKKMLAIRQSKRVFNDNQSIEVLDTGNEHVFAFYRTEGDEKFLFLANVGRETQHLDLHFLGPVRMERYRIKDLWGELTFDNSRLVIEPCGMHWLYCSS